MWALAEDANPFESKGSSLPSLDFLHWEPLAVDAPDGGGKKLTQGSGTKKKGVVEMDHTLQASS